MYLHQKEHSQILTTKRKTTQLKNCQNSWTNISPKIYKSLMRMYSLARPGLAGLREMSNPKAEAEKIQDEP